MLRPTRPESSTQNEVSSVIQKNWQDLIKPSKLEVTQGYDPSRTATIVVEPL